MQGASKCFRKLGGVNTTTIIREHFMFFKNMITNSTTNKKIKWYKRLKNENSNQIMIPLNSLKECIWCKFCWPFHSQGLNNIHRTICHQLLRQGRSWDGGGGGSWEPHPLPLYKLLLFLTEAKQGMTILCQVGNPRLKTFSETKVIKLHYFSI